MLVWLLIFQRLSLICPIFFLQALPACPCTFHRFQSPEILLPWSNSRAGVSVVAALTDKKITIRCRHPKLLKLHVNLMIVHTIIIFPMHIWIPSPTETQYTHIIREDDSNPRKAHSHLICCQVWRSWSHQSLWITFTWMKRNQKGHWILGKTFFFLAPYSYFVTLFWHHKCH